MITYLISFDLIIRASKYPFSLCPFFSLSRAQKSERSRARSGRLAYLHLSFCAPAVCVASLFLPLFYHLVLFPFSGVFHTTHMRKYTHKHIHEYTLMRTCTDGARQLEWHHHQEVPRGTPWGVKGKKQFKPDDVLEMVVTRVSRGGVGAPICNWCL